MLQTLHCLKQARPTDSSWATCCLYRTLYCLWRHLEWKKVF